MKTATQGQKYGPSNFFPVPSVGGKAFEHRQMKYVQTWAEAHRLMELGYKVIAWGPNEVALSKPKGA